MVIFGLAIIAFGIFGLGLFVGCTIRDDQRLRPE
jgi:hypothetical protein